MDIGSGSIRLAALARRPGGREGTHRPRLSRVARRREPGNPCEDLLEQRLRHRHLRHLESHVPGVPDDPRPGLDEFLAQCRQRPVLHAPREHQSAQEVGKVVGQTDI